MTVGTGVFVELCLRPVAICQAWSGEDDGPRSWKPAEARAVASHTSEAKQCRLANAGALVVKKC